VVEGEDGGSPGGRDGDSPNREGQKHFGALVLGVYEGTHDSHRMWGADFSERPGDIRGRNGSWSKRNVRSTGVPQHPRLRSGQRPGITWVRPELVCEVSLSAGRRCRHEASGLSQNARGQDCRRSGAGILKTILPQPKTGASQRGRRGKEHLWHSSMRSGLETLRTLEIFDTEKRIERG